jgi:outer membrane protein assembly factor BamB
MRYALWTFVALGLLTPAAASGVQVISEFVPTYHVPTGLTWDGTALWAIESGTRVHRHDPQSGEELWSILPISQSFLPQLGIAWDGRHLWACSWPGLQVAEIDPLDGRVLRVVPLQGEHGIIDGAPVGLVWKDEALWMLMSGPSYICRVDPATGQMSERVSLPLYSHYMGLAWDGMSFWTASVSASSVVKLDPHTGTAMGFFPSPGRGPTGVAWDGRYMWVASERLYKVDIQAEPYEPMVELRSFPWGYYNHYFDVEWDSGLLWLSGSSIALFDPAAPSQPVRTLGVPAEAVGGIASDGAHLWVATRYFSPTLYELDPAFGAVLAEYPYKEYWGIPMGMTFDGQNLWVADTGDSALYVFSWPQAVLQRSVHTPGPGAVGAAWDGRALWHNDYLTDLLYKLDRSSGAVEEEYRLPMGLAYGIAANRQRGTMWVVDWGNSRTVELDFPPGPTHILGFSGMASDSSVTLSWTLTEGSSATSINVERRTSADTLYRSLGPARCVGGGCEFTDSAPVPETISYYRLRIEETAGSVKHIGPLSVAYHLSYQPISALGDSARPRCGVIPNPSSRGMAIWYAGTPGCAVRMRVFDVRGRRVQSLTLAPGPSGIATLSWDGHGEDGRPLPSGVYFGALEDERGGRAMARMVIVR